MDLGAPRKGIARLMTSARARGMSIPGVLTTLSLAAAVVALVTGLTDAGIQKNFSLRVRSEIQEISRALEAYKADHGHYPAANGTDFSEAAAKDQTGGWRNIVAVYRALNGSDGGKKYMDFKPSQIQRDDTLAAGDYYIVDPRGRPYGYNPNAPLVNKKSYDLFSTGYDRRPDYTPATVTSRTNNDIGNW